MKISHINKFVCGSTSFLCGFIIIDWWINTLNYNGIKYVTLIIISLLIKLFLYKKVQILFLTPFFLSLFSTTTNTINCYTHKFPVNRRRCYGRESRYKKIIVSLSPFSIIYNPLHHFLSLYKLVAFARLFNSSNIISTKVSKTSTHTTQYPLCWLPISSFSPVLPNSIVQLVFCWLLFEFFFFILWGGTC
jgi:hypothetical protein